MLRYFIRISLEDLTNQFLMPVRESSGFGYARGVIAEKKGGQPSGR